MKENKQNIVRFYLDQNVIDYLLKGNLDFLQEYIDKTQNVEIVYSNVTLKEFARIEDDSQRKLYLDYLKRVNAKYFWIDEDELAYFNNVDPFEIFDSNIKNNMIYKDVENSMLEMAHKLAGGKKDVSFDEIAILQKNSFSYLMGNIFTTIDTLDEVSAIEKDLLKKHSQYMNTQFSELIDKLIQQLKDTNYNNEHPSNDLRWLLNIKVDKLNEIEPPYIINQIWNIMKDVIKNSNINITYNDLFGDGFSKFCPTQKITMSKKINWLFYMLNSIGYFADKNIRNHKRFIPFINDLQHIGAAIYSDIFITRDRRLMKKTEAVYEHLKIKTKIILVQ